MKDHENHQHICNECGKGFGVIQNLKNHLNTVHNDKNNFKCALCGAKFKTNDKIKRHVQLHSQVNLFKCSVCDQEFKTAVLARTHRSKEHASKGDVVKIDVDTLNLLNEKLIVKILPEPNEYGENRHRTRNAQPFLGVL